ncbi:Na+/H+ antiporter NhaC family protein [Pseudoxanthomonas daejeonensis]|uniref:Na+/H+ antiporter NhaC n=1 Tax=Pseudoxanthomonas daejeonensis TaxID=266062 RepID=A0ABQ6Z409_9GAMM|nr:Na+/H+ antiporter NhaC family protein [Pseudoxanthomonas daejeonensis]KAF1692445.1 Na+/H+ antiporter NhaC [Pseudoxanthomonas daejeonensis]
MERAPETPRPVRAPSYLDAALPLVVLVVLVGTSVALFGMAAIDGPMQVAMILASMSAVAVILKNGHRWEAIAQSGQKGLSTVVGAIFILLAVGALIGTWNMSGTIPTLVYYGIKLISPAWFLPVAFLVCAAISLSIGSSWTTAGTVGVGLMGLAHMIGVSPAMTAGAVIAGAYVGDKTSPLSETTVLAAQLNGVDLFRHIRYQAWTAVPAGLIALAVFVALGFSQRGGLSDAVVSSELAHIDQLFDISAWNLLPLLLLLAMSMRKVPATLAIMCSALLAGVMATLLQPQAVAQFVASADESVVVVSIKGVWLAMANGFSVDTGMAEVDALLSRGGMDSMLLTIWLIIGAVTFGILVDDFGLLGKLVAPLLHRARTTGRLFASVVGTSIGLNIAAGDQYIALLLPTRLYASEFARRGLAPENLSRATGDAGIVTSALVPWNSCGAYMSVVLGVSTMAYLPFAVFNYAAPLLTLLLGFTGWRIARLPAGDAADTPAAPSPAREQ